MSQMEHILGSTECPAGRPSVTHRMSMHMSCDVAPVISRLSDLHVHVHVRVACACNPKASSTITAQHSNRQALQYK
jgi:hypothetical protein